MLVLVVGNAHLGKKERKEGKTKEKRLNRSRPHVLGHSGLQLIVLWLCACRSSDGRVGKVHMRRHGAGVGRRSTGIRVAKVMSRARRRDACMRRRGPAQTRHMRASIDATRAMVVVGWWLQGLRRAIACGMRRHGGAHWGRTAVARQRWRRGRGRGTRAGLRKVTAEVRWDWPASVVVTHGSRHMQGWEVPGWRHRGVMCWRGGRVNRGVL